MGQRAAPGRPARLYVQRSRAAVDGDGVVAIGGEGDRQGEFEWRPAVDRPGCRGGDRHRAAKEASRTHEVAPDDGLADRGASDLLAIERERWHDPAREAVTSTELGPGRRRAAPLEAERGVRRHQEAAKLDPRADP